MFGDENDFKSFIITSGLPKSSEISSDFHTASLIEIQREDKPNLVVAFKWLAPKFAENRKLFPALCPSIPRNPPLSGSIWTGHVNLHLVPRVFSVFKRVARWYAINAGLSSLNADSPVDAFEPEVNLGNVCRVLRFLLRERKRKWRGIPKANV